MSSPVVLITGALTGIGRATAFAFAKEAARVVVSGRRDDAGEALAIELRATGAEAEFIRADVRHENDVRNLVDNTVARFGRLDVAVNNAGTEGKPGPVGRPRSRQPAAKSSGPRSAAAPPRPGAKSCARCLTFSGLATC
jgi:NAD(P)-dependent dehydrogenase (short-subunit alcohol dehydrogenase family)